ncbi:Mitogen-activated protein kinase kinase kinase 7 [Strongyloides ratti]|uniref:Mitogen-activated protein kinase kinase kinase 7 n=1 Tax=Strongyloides ratti TaxID=34506 RepID=A0A090LCC7_STRRB|nr:Mitogen-activated protein kinase kinase kinase 7 [Strongyloides ratti]CEF67451.1 Mitogen-activated protein kinase kinase kinase 7 [Strongyloides ratti]
MDQLTIDIKKADVCDADMHRYLFSTSIDNESIINITKGLFTFSLDDFTCKPFSENNKIGVGNFADIYKVLQKNGKYVALKMLKTHNTTINYHYYNEINALKQLNHPNIIKFLGILKGNLLGIILEYHEGGNLKDILKNWKSQYCENINKWIIGLSSALVSIHNINFCHGDINPFNILLSNDLKTAIFCDFGSSKENNQKPEAFAGMSCYRPPELNFSSSYTTKCDIYSFGMVLWEIFTRESPYDTSKNEIEIMWNVAYANLKPNICNSKIPVSFQEIINSCLEVCPDNRICSEVLYKKITEIL